MFSLKNKLDADLKKAIEKKHYKTFRVIIHCRSLQENTESKIKTYGGKIIHSIPSINCIVANVQLRTIDRLIELPQINYITFDNYANLCGNSVHSANGIAFQERYKLTGKGIGIGIIDSGTYPHPDLINPYNKIRKFLDLINGFMYPYDDNGHGTFISGLICGSGYMSKGMYRGIAENSNLYSIKAFNDIGKGFISDILFSIQTLILEKDELNIKVICLPFELQYNDYFILSLFQKLFDKAIENNIIIVVPSGHNGNYQSSIRGIATLDNCITVGGLNTSCEKICPYKNASSGPVGKLTKPELSAACVDICSLNSNTNYLSERNGMKVYPQSLEKPYVYYTGTSCASAYISGVCALLFENNPNLTFKDVVSLLKISSKLLDISKYIQGHGMVDLNKLLP